MRVSLSKTFRFEAAHHLPTFPEGHKCRRLHGHSFRFDVVVEGEVLPEAGYLIDYGEIKKALADAARGTRPLDDNGPTAGQRVPDTGDCA